MGDITKKDLIEMIAEEYDITKSRSKEIIERIFVRIAEEAANGNKTRIPEIGTFEPKHRNARSARNPLTGEKIEVKAKTVLSYKPSPALRDL
ncbi:MULTISPECIES: HU family DNA-binding protein [unclassified Thioalkalivibrio]|uniref:HU family DNA-binding protein n=1 Tax=unclassified Thioalkalivibrio TaxID=2621013 RepID=UPI000372C6D6|nr:MULTISPECIES: HU family DNA-binding protein [unclassified Thioalkalivibrio]